MKEAPAAEAVAAAGDAEKLREALEDVLTILGDPSGYCESDRTEVAQAVAHVERALGRRPQDRWRRARQVDPGAVTSDARPIKNSDATQVTPAT